MAYILLVDKTLNEIESAAAYLSGKQHIVVTSTDGHEALSIVTENPPDILVTRGMLPGKYEGFHLISRYIEKSRRRTRISLITEIAADNEPLRDWSMAIDSYILPPYTFWHIVLAVEQLLYRTINPAVIQNWK